MKTASKAKASSMARIIERLAKDPEARKQAQVSRSQFERGQTQTLAGLRKSLLAKERKRKSTLHAAGEERALVLEGAAR